MYHIINLEIRAKAYRKHNFTCDFYKLFLCKFIAAILQIYKEVAILSIMFVL